MKEVLYGMSFLEENQMVHADIRPELIGVPITRNDNFILLDRLGDPSPPNKVQFNNIKNKKNLYTSPAIYKSILKRKTRIRHNPFKSDMFSLGMIILEAGILESVQSVYNRKNKKINESRLVELVEIFIKKYSDNYTLQESLMIMLEFSEKLRQSPTQMLQTIRELKQVEIDEGRAQISYINYANDAMMNQLQFTESGYRLKEMDKINYSNFYKYEKSSNLNLMKSEEISFGDEMRNSLFENVRNKQSLYSVKNEKNLSKNWNVDNIVKEETEKSEISERNTFGQNSNDKYFVKNSTENHKMNDTNFHPNELDSFLQHEENVKQEIQKVKI